MVFPSKTRVVVMEMAVDPEAPPLLQKMPSLQAMLGSNTKAVQPVQAQQDTTVAAAQGVTAPYWATTSQDPIVQDETPTRAEASPLDTYSRQPSASKDTPLRPREAGDDEPVLPAGQTPSRPEQLVEPEPEP